MGIVELVLLLLVFAVLALFVKLDTLSDRLRRLERAVNSPQPVVAQAQPPKQAAEISQPRQVTVKASLSAATPAKPAGQTTTPPPTSPRPASNQNKQYESQTPAWMQEIIDRVKAYFTEGNLFVRLGIIILFFGVAFLLRFAAQHSMLPVELRLIGVTAGSMVLLVLGWRLRINRPAYGLILQGGGVGVLYLTLFAAFRLYHLLPAWLTFPLLLIVVVFSAALAVMQNSRALVVLSISGGFLAPVLASTGSGSHVALFSYYAILNVAILGMAWFKAWRMLNVLGFVFTFVIGAAWGVTKYRADLFASTEPFLVLFFLFYVAIAVLFAIRQAPDLKGYVDGTLVFGVPLLGFALQSALVHRYDYGLALSALAAGFIYLFLARMVWMRGGQQLRMLAESFLALGVVFASLTIPFALDGEWIATAWALEGAAILWIGVRQQRRLAVVFAVLLQFGAGIGFVAEASSRYGHWPVLNSVFMGAMIVGLAGLFSAYYLHLHFVLQGKSTWRAALSRVMLVWGLLWWFANGFNEIDAYVNHRFEISGFIIFAAASCGLFALLEARLPWRSLRYLIYVYALFLIGILLVVSIDQTHVFARNGYIAWPFALAVYYFQLQQRDVLFPPIRGLTLLHAIGLWLGVIIASVEIYYLTADKAGLGDAWQAIAFAVASVLALQAVLQWKRWPVHAHRQRYLGWVSWPLLLVLCAWSLLSDLSHQAGMEPLPYLPLLNPLDIMHVIVLITLVQWWRHANTHSVALINRPQALVVIAVLSFAWLNAVLLRSLHHWAGIPYDIDIMAHSLMVQASLSIFWTLLGLAIMVVATHKHWRPVWIAAAVLLGVVIVKLFAVDLAGRDTLATIVSFIVVGVLMLVVGYFSPLPPKHKNALAGSNE